MSRLVAETLVLKVWMQKTIAFADSLQQQTVWTVCVI